MYTIRCCETRFSCKNPGAGGRSEKAEVKHEKDLIYYRDAAHLGCADLPYHYIIEHTDEIRYKVLYHYRNGDSHNHLVKVSVANISLKH